MKDTNKRISDKAIFKLTALKQTLRNNGFTFAPEDIQFIQVVLIDQQKIIEDLRIENIRLIKKNMAVK